MVAFPSAHDVAQEWRSQATRKVGPNGDSVETVSSLIYSRIMQEGTQRGPLGQSSNGSPIPWGDIPARPFLGISSQDEFNIGEAITEWLEAALSKDSFPAPQEQPRRRPHLPNRRTPHNPT